MKDVEIEGVKHYTLFVPFKTVFFVPDHYGVVLDNAEVLAEKGAKVDVVYCDGKAINNCIFNCYGDKSLCKVCKMYQKHLFRHIKNKQSISIIPVSNFSKGNEPTLSDFMRQHPFSTISELEQIEYKGVKVGLAAFSSYLTLSRNLYPLVDDQFKDFISRYMYMCAKTTDLVNTALEQLQPGGVACFNARFICCRPVYDLCMTKHIPFCSYEVGFNTQNKINKKYFHNVMPHSLDYNTQLINDLWESPKRTKEEKIETATNFFKKRRSSIASGDKVSYTTLQKSGQLPANWDPSKHNIAIFNSSEDEFASLGEEFKELSLFPNQFTGIQYLFEKFGNDPSIHLYLRIHPNLKDIPYSYHKKLLEFTGKYENVTIIPGNSPVSTYALIDNSDKILIFGSSVGFEAAYAKKPVVLLGCAMYRNLGISYVPQNTEELDQLVMDKTLQPKEILGALKFSYFTVNDEWEPMKYFTDNTKSKKKIFGKVLTLTRCQIKGHPLSPYFSYLYQIVGKFFWYRSNHSFPTKEQ